MRVCGKILFVIFGVALAYKWRYRLLHVLCFIPSVRRFIVMRELRNFEHMNDLS